MRPYIVVRAPAGFRGFTKRHAFYCTTRTEAAELRREIKTWKSARKQEGRTLSFGETDKRWIAYLHAHVGNLNLLPEIVAHWERTAKTIVNPMTVRALADAYVLYRATKRLGRKTLADDRYIARKLIDALGAKQAHEVLPGDIRKLLDAAPSESTARKIYKVVSLIFDYGKENRALAIHPMIDIDRPEVAYVTPTTLTPSQFGILLNAADDQLLPYLAIAGFAGLRRSELVRQHADDDVLDWSDIDFNKRLITVRDTVAKATQRKHGDRRFIPMEDALVHWLGPIKRVHGSVVPVRETVFSRQMRRLHAATGIAPEPNALRHSFASYWLARAELEGVGALAKRMGNSESVARRHYIESLSPAEGQAWFAIRRAETRTAVLPFPKSAA